MKPRMSFLIGTVLVSAFANAKLSGQTVSNDVIKVETTSPYEIARMVNLGKHGRDAQPIDLSLTWKRLGIESMYFEVCGDCDAQVTSYDLDGKPGPEVLVKLIGVPQACRFLIFKQDATGWKLLGHIDHDFNRYRMAEHRVVRFGGKPWLVINSQAGSGSGFSLYDETWYRVADNGIRKVLSYPVEGRTYPWPAGLARDFKARPVTSGSTIKAPRNLTIRYQVTYSKCDGVTPKCSKLISNQHRLTYVWDARSNTFVPDASRSNISEREISVIANVEPKEDPPEATIGNTHFYSENKAWVGGGYELFLKYNLAALLRIARDKNNKHREWLRSFLKDCDNTAEKKELIQALGNEK